MIELKTSVKSIQHSLDESTTNIEPTDKEPKAPPSGEPTSRGIQIGALVDDKADFQSSFEADDFKLKEVFQHIGQPMLSFETTRRHGRLQRDSGKRRPLLVRFTSEWVALKILSKAHKLKSYPVPLFF